MFGGGASPSQATDDSAVSVTAELVSASTSRCLTVPSASPGDVAIVNITNTGATGNGWGALRSSDDDPVHERPTNDQYASVNFAANTPPNPNLAITTVGTDNTFCYDGAVSAHHVILDLAAIIPAQHITPITPTRILDTRPDSNPVSANSSRCLTVPAASPGDVAIVNITNTGATGNGWGALRSSDDDPVHERPTNDQYASVNFAANTPPNPNLAITTVGTDNTFCYDGAVSAHHVILDLAAIIPAQHITPITPTRILDTRPDSGLQSLFIGHSFFRPIASRFGDHAVAAGFSDHQQTIISAGGENGAPEALWNNPTRRAKIQAELAGGDIELFGMTYHPEYPTLVGYRLWIDEALAHNPDTIIFIGFPWLTHPGRYSPSEYRAEWNAAYDDAAPDFISTLRSEYPNTEIFAIPYGRSAGELYVRFGDDELPEISALVGNKSTALFVDDFGHAGLMILDLATLVWLRAIYGVDVSAYDNGFGYDTDLGAVATQIMDEHDPLLDQP